MVVIDDALGRLVRIRGDAGAREALEAAIEAAVVDAVAGEPAGPGLARTLERLAREVLLRAGLGDARVRATSGPAGTSVDVLLPPPPARVRTVQTNVRRTR